MIPKGSIRLGDHPGPLGRIGLGAMLLSLASRPDRETAKAVIRRAVELGMNLIDTADVYALDDGDIGHNERLIAEALAEMGPQASDVLVATKGGMRRPEGRWVKAARPERLRAACEASLVALGVDSIALYQLHAPDPEVPFAESVGALARLREEGKVRAVGLSNVGVAQIEEARSIVPIASVQNWLSPWSIGSRPGPVVRYCERESLVFLAYAPMGGASRAPLLGRSRALVELGRELGATPFQLALAALLHESPAVVPIPSSTRLATVESSVRAASIELDEVDRARLRRAFAELSGQPSWVRRAFSRLRRAIGA